MYCITHRSFLSKLVTINSEIVRRVGGDTKRVEAADSLFYGCFVRVQVNHVLKVNAPQAVGYGVKLNPVTSLASQHAR